MALDELKKQILELYSAKTKGLYVDTVPISNPAQNPVHKAQVNKSLKNLFFDKVSRIPANILPYIIIWQSPYDAKEYRSKLSI